MMHGQKKHQVSLFVCRMKEFENLVTSSH